MKPNRLFHILILPSLLWMAALACQAVPTTNTPTIQFTPTATRTTRPTATFTRPPSSTSTATSTRLPTDTITATPTNTTLPPTPTAIPAVSFQLVDLSASKGDFTSLLSQHAAKAHEMGLTPFVEFHAAWCPACQAIAQGLEEKNALMRDAFQWTYLIRVDIDQWDTDEIVNAGFEFEFIPIFIRINTNGSPTSDSIDGNAWGENIPETMAPPLKEFFQTYHNP
jgi:hypothetical protein